MTTQDHCLEKTNGENFFNYVKSKSSRKTYCSLYDYMKHWTQELSQEQSFYVFDLADVLWKAQLWREKLPDVTPFYAVKANPDPVLIRLFALLGFSFDCSTRGEISLVLENGVNPQNIIYAHTIKPHTSLKYASKVGVDFMTFDCEEELYKIQKHFPDARLVMRLKPESPNCSFDLSLKYGCAFKDAEQLLLRAKDLNLEVVGLSFHVGILCKDPTSFTKTIHNCRLVWNTAQRLGFQFTVLNLGSGFFGSTQKEKYFDMITTEIKNALKQHFPENNVKIMAEPGCYYVCSAQKNVTCVLGRKTNNKRNSITNDNHNDISQKTEVNEIQRYYYINDGFYGSFFSQTELYDIIPKPLLDLPDLNKRPVYKSKIWGQTCCSEDVVQENCLLTEMQDGEYLVWENMGAYTRTLCSTFTTVPIPAAKRVFIKNMRLNLNWIKNYDEIVKFLSENVDLIESGEFFLQNSDNY